MMSRVKTADGIQVHRASLLSRGVSWLILQVLGISLLTVFAGIGFSAYKYSLSDQHVAAAPEPFSPAAVYASPVPPIDYRQHPPPAGTTAGLVPPSPPLPAFVSVQAHRLAPRAHRVVLRH